MALLPLSLHLCRSPVGTGLPGGRSRYAMKQDDGVLDVMGINLASFVEGRGL